MFFLYSIILTLGFILLLPRFAFDWVRKGKYAAGFKQRLGHLPEFKQSLKPVLWIHCVSVGEANAARPLVEEILKEFPDYRLVVSTTTDSGQKLAEEIFADFAEQIFYFPFDWQFTVQRALNHYKPNIILVMETEYWLNFFREAFKSGAILFIVNGRLSEKSFRRFLYTKKFVRRVFHYVRLALMQSEEDAQRLIDLGIRSSKIKITGNIKYDQSFSEPDDIYSDYFRQRFDITENAPLILAASTHQPEEKLILEAFKQVWKNSEGKLPRLLIAPRHPERFKEVKNLIKKSGFDWATRSEAISERDKAAEIILLDSIGELRSVFPLARIVFVGGSLIPHGGQNILEPAVAGKAIVTGFHTKNFSAIMDEFIKENAVVQLPELSKSEIVPALVGVFSELLQNNERRSELAQNARSAVLQMRGATERTVEYLKPYLVVHNQ